MPTDDDIKKALRRIPKESYPKDLQTATKAEFTTMAKQYKKDKKDGCRDLFILAILIVVLVIML